jgi:hypothetical protein
MEGHQRAEHRYGQEGPAYHLSSLQSASTRINNGI